MYIATEAVARSAQAAGRRDGRKINNLRPAGCLERETEEVKEMRTGNESWSLTGELVIILSSLRELVLGVNAE
jgi:hypothetical protein